MTPLAHIEIPVRRLDRAMSFYSYVLDASLGDIVTVHSSAFAFFAQRGAVGGGSLALAESADHAPTSNGALLYFAVDDIDGAIDKARRWGSRLLFPKTALGPNCVVAGLLDSEGNRIALQASSAANGDAKIA